MAKKKMTASRSAAQDVERLARQLADEQGVELGVDMGSRIPLFDIEIGAEKQSPYSRLSQNEMAMQFFSAGLFDPARWEQALGALEIMDFDGKGSVERAIRENGQRYAAQERRQV